MLAQIAILVSGFGVSIILGRGLGPADFGTYGVVMAVLTMTERTLSAGFPRAAAGMIASGSGPRDELEQASRILMFLWGLVLGAVLWMGAPLLAAYFQTDAGMIRILAANVPAMAIFVANDAILSGHGQFGTQGALQTVQSFVKLLGVAILLVIGLTVSGVFVAHVIGTLAVAVIVLLMFRPRLEVPSWSLMQPMVRIAFTTGFYTIALALLLSLGLWQFDALRPADAAEVGVYVAGQNVTRLLLIVPASLSGVLFSSASRAAGASHDELFRKHLGDAMRFGLILLLPACVLMGVDAENVVELLFGARYEGGGRVLAALCIGYAAMGLFDILAHGLMAAGRFGFVSLLACLMVPVLAVLNLLLIPDMHAVGAAASMAIVFLAGSVVVAVMLYRSTGSFMHWVTGFRVALACTTAGAISWLAPVSAGWVPVKLAVVGAIYLGLLWLLREISPADAAILLKRKRS